MRFWDFKRSLAGVRLLIQYGVEQGFDVTELLAGSRISALHLADPHAEVTAEQELRVLENLVRLLRNPPLLGVQLGLSYRLATFGIWGYGLISSATLGASLDMALQFLPLTTAYSAISYRIEGEQVVLRFVPPQLNPKLARVLVERDMAATAALLHQNGGDAFRLLRFGLPPPGGSTPTRPMSPTHVFGARLDTSAKEHLLAFDRVHLARPLPQADPATAEMCRQMCAQLLERRRTHIGTVALVEHFLSAQPAGTLPSLASFASMLNTSERTLKRRLQAEGTSFRDLSTRLQATAAAALVADESYTLTQVAEQLGYADLSSFSQAFKRWHGTSPSSFRSSPRLG